MKKILVVFGTRPEAVKMAPLIKRLNKNSSLFETVVCVTGQHREMLDQVLDIFEIVPDFDLCIMKSGQDLYDITSKVLIGMRNVLQEVKPGFGLSSWRILLLLFATAFSCLLSTYTCWGM